MHILIAIVVLVLVYLYFSQRQRRDGSSAAGWGQAPSSTSTRRLAFVARGKLFYAAAGETPREVHSPHVQAAMDRLERSRERHAWKQGTAFGVHAMGRMREGVETALPLQATSVQFAPSGRVIYFLRDHAMGGLFDQDLADGSERRLLHRQNLLLDDLRLSADGERLLASQQNGNGSANIVGMRADGDDFRELTGGDTLDTAPSWVPGKPHQLVFQSAGLARNPEGHVMAVGPASIQLLDTTTGALTPVFDDARYDFLQPRVAQDGSLLFIRRPHEGPRYRGGDLITDVLLFPFRLLRTLFDFLNFQSLVYSRKPLSSAGGPQHEADLKDILLKGRRIDADAALRRGERVQGIPSLVPASWQLVWRSEAGDERVLARHVASFDLTADGGVIYSNGFGVFALHPGGQPSVVLRDKLIAEVVSG